MLGLENAARAAGYSLSVTILDDASAGSMRSAVDAFVGHAVDAIVVLTTYGEALDALKAIAAPVPLIAVQGGRDADRPAVWVDQQAGAGLAVRHLLDLGHRTVHHVAGPADSLEARGRIVGWRRTLQAAGAHVPELLFGDWWPASGYAAGKELAARAGDGRSDVTAVFVANDQMTLGLLTALDEEGLRVPRDISVVGFDDVPEAAFYNPPLTTVQQDFAELGRRGVELVLAKLRGEDVQPEPVAPSLVVRKTTAAPGGAAQPARPAPRRPRRVSIA
jgi:DNA-binding LacI/PurR family transcriptional regulator